MWAVLRVSTFDRDAFVDGYIEAALWADCMPPEDDPNGELGGREHLVLRPGARQKMAVDCLDFIAANEVDLERYAEHAISTTPVDVGRPYGGDAVLRAAWERAGHDFWLTRNGHGAGFWDRGLGALGERLSEAAKVYGSADDHRPYDCGDGTADA